MEIIKVSASSLIAKNRVANRPPLYSVKDMAEQLGSTDKAIYYIIEKLNIEPDAKFAKQNVRSKWAFSREKWLIIRDEYLRVHK